MAVPSGRVRLLKWLLFPVLAAASPVWAAQDPPPPPPPPAMPPPPSMPPPPLPPPPVEEEVVGAPAPERGHHAARSHRGGASRTARARCRKTSWSPARASGARI